MKCSQCQEGLVAYLEGHLDGSQARQLEAHLADCPGCRSELAELRRLVSALDHDGAPVRAISLGDSVMDRIVQEQAIELRRFQMRRRMRWIGLSGTAVAAVLLVAASVFWSGRLEEASAADITAAQVLAKGCEAAPKASSIYYEAEVRTLPRDNFSLIVPDHEPVRIDVWKQSDDLSRWRVQKPGRVVVMDGTSTVMLIEPNMAVKVGPSQGAFDTGWLLNLTNVGGLLDEELRTALAHEWDLKLDHEKTEDGMPKLVVTVEAKAGLPEGNYLKNKFFDTADTRRVYRFDAKSGRLEGLDVYLHQRTGEPLVFTIKKIEYDQTINPDIFTLKLPKDVAWIPTEVEKLPDNEKYEEMTPKQVARAFFEACSKENWDEAKKFFPVPLNGKIKEAIGGLKILSLGEPFQAKPYSGWFVPYEIEFKSGEIKKHNLAVRNDNPAKRYVVDGGF